MSDLVQYKVSQFEECGIKQNLYQEIDSWCVCDFTVNKGHTKSFQKNADPNARLTDLMYMVSGFILRICGVIMMVGLVHT